MSQRPLSPHLTIYRPQISSVLSIMHRMTGVALFFGALLLVTWLVVAAFYPSLYSGLHALLSGVFGRLVLFGFTFAFYYHLCNGIRHLFWDMGKGFDLKVMARTGWLVLFSAVSLAVATFFIALGGA